MNGLLLIDKPQGMTSHDVVARVRRLIGIRAIGHTGTLDPFATGLLILCVGLATRLSEYLIGQDKTYIGTMRLGERTNTDDVDGEVVMRRPVVVTLEDLERARVSHLGDISQVPPQYSAIQIGGRRAYKLARKGETVEIPARQVRISELVLTPGHDIGALAPACDVDLRVTCTSGTYIRALARDIGEVLGCGAHLTALRRIRSGTFSLDEAITLEALQQHAAAGTWPRCLLPMDRGVEQFPAAHLDHDASTRFVMGGPVAVPHENSPDKLWRVYDADAQFVAIGELDRATSLLRPLKVFHTRE